jgi:hypothetical protein
MKIKDLTWINLAALRTMSSTSVLSLRLKNHIIKVII